CTSQGKEFIIGTEVGILHRLGQECPEKRCFPLSEKAVCVNMKKTDLQKVYNALERMSPRVTVPGEIVGRARKAIDRMLAVR
ncbi:MAG TPA: quinolinate synthase NadA, partial [Methanomicrobiales archaeon]|nr:quinolinate synthase NadA [Methanomicrobiales archaeon]